MDKGKLEELYHEHRHSVYNKVENGEHAQNFDEEYKGLLKKYLNELQDKLYEVGLLNDATQEFSESELPVYFNGSFKENLTSHRQTTFDLFNHFTRTEYKTTIEALDDPSMSDEDKSDTYKQQNVQKKGMLEDKKQEDKRDIYRLLGQMESVIAAYTTNISSRAVQTTYARDISDRIQEFKYRIGNISQKLLEGTQDLLVHDIDAVHSIIEKQMEEYERQFREEAGLDDLDKASETQTISEEETPYTQELADAFASGKVDVTKLTAGEMKLYINFMFDEPMPEIVNPRETISSKPELEELPIPDLDGPKSEPTYESPLDMFRKLTKPDNKPELEELPMPNLDDPMPEDTTSSPLDIFRRGLSNPDVAPELQPLPPDELKAYQDRVKKAMEESDKPEVDKDKNTDKDDKKTKKDWEDLFL